MDRFNNKLNRFVTRASGICSGCPGDSLDFIQAYAFQPKKILPQMLCKIEVDRVLMILVTQNWPRETWYTDILRQAMASSKFQVLMNSNLYLICSYP